MTDDNKNLDDPYLTELDSLDDLALPEEESSEEAPVARKTSPRPEAAGKSPKVVGADDDEGAARAGTARAGAARADAADEEEPVVENHGRPIFSEEEDVAPEVPVHVVAVIGKRQITLKDLLDLKSGDVLEMDRTPRDMVDIVANGKLVGRGELVVIDGKIGVRVVKLIT